MINEFNALAMTFPECSQQEIHKLYSSYNFTNKRGRPENSFRTSSLLSDCVRHLESKGYEFGCGAKDGCTPGCTC
jgi:hypothetical protein